MMEAASISIKCSDNIEGSEGNQLTVNLLFAHMIHVNIWLTGPTCGIFFCYITNTLFYKALNTHSMSISGSHFGPSVQIFARNACSLFFTFPLPTIVSQVIEEHG